MPRIPLPGVPDVKPANYQGAAPASKVAIYRGQAAAAEGIEQAGDVMMRFALRSAEVKNEADLSRARLAMQQAQADMQADFEANPDPEKWEGLAQQRIEQAQGSVFVANERGGVSMAPAVRRELEQQFQAFAQSQTLTVRNQAQRARNAEADRLLTQEQGREIASGRLDGALAIVDKRESLGLISPVQAKLEREAVAHDVDVETLNRDIADDPFTALEKLENRTDGGSPRFYKQLSEKDRLSAIRAAKTGIATMRAETMQSLQEYILERGGIGAEAKIDTWLEAGRILPSQALNLKKFAAGQRKPQDMAAAGAHLWQAALDLDRADPDYIQKAMAIRAEVHALDPVIRDPILDALQGKERNDVREDVQRAYDALNRDFRANTFGNVQTYTQAEIDKDRKLRKAGLKEGDPKDRAEYERASATLWRYQRAMRDYLSANPKATIEDIQAFRQRLTSTDTQAALGGVVVDALSGAVQ